MIRKQIEELERWYSKKRRKPLVVWGARQVGKTYLVKTLFAKTHFKDYVYIDLQKDDDARAFFQTTSNPSKYLSYIESRYNKKISNKLPLIFDEVQACSSVLSSLKYFWQDFPELPVIATGSMVRLALKHSHNNGEGNDFLFPVGAIDSIDVYPLTFEEYLLNSNKVLLERIKKAYSDREPLSSFDHELALDSLYEFLSIGGLPEAVDVFLKEKSYKETYEVINNIYNNYLSDMDTYNVSNETILKTRRIYNNIFNQLNKENKNFKISQLGKGKSNRDYFNAYQWLQLAKIVHRSKKKTGKVSLPLIEEDEGLFRMYLSDSGMFAYQSNVKRSDFLVKDKRNELSGIFFENYVATELVANDIPLFYWVGKMQHEFEFIVENNGKIIPIDVKKRKGTLNSLNEFRCCNPHSLAIKISSNNYGYNSDNKILTIPLYETFLLAQDIAEGNELN